MKKPFGQASAEIRSTRRRTFLDSNVLIYAEDAADPDKQVRAVEIIVEQRRQRTGVVSLQVLGEYFSAMTRKFKLDAAIARSQVEFYSNFEIIEPGVEDVFAAIDLHRLNGYSYWDSLIVRCAQRSGCSVLLTEDLQHGQLIGGVKVVNPFLDE